VSDALRVAFVCTGNRFRSPLAAALLESDTEGLPLKIASLGTLDLGAEPALPEAVALAEELGVDLAAHRARTVAAEDLSAYDLVVGFERKHVVSSVVEGGASIERTFTLPELVGLLREAAETPPSARDRIHAAHELRPPGFRNAPLPELPDPLGRSAPEQREIANRLADLVSELRDELFA
jgi:protein-tyrosine-phosphatase